MPDSSTQKSSFSESNRSSQSISSLQSMFSSVRAMLTQSPCLVLLPNLPSETKTTLLAYVPNDAHVREKMVYAASRASLKEGLDITCFGEDYFITEKEECSYEVYVARQRGEEVEVMTLEERTKREEAVNCVATSVRAVALPAMMLEVRENARQVVEKIKEKRDGLVGVFTLDAESQALLGEEIFLDRIFPDIHNYLKMVKEPCYVLYNYTHGQKTMMSIMLFCECRL